MKILKYKETTIAQSRDTGMAMVLLLLITQVYTKREIMIFGAVGLQLVNMVLPSLFKPVAVVWFNLSRILGEVSSRVLLSIIYFGVVTPFGFVRRLAGKDALRLRVFKQSDVSVMTDRNHKFSGHDIVRPY